jgi:hypothetical protein
MWVFNVADACVCIGAGLMALWLILDMIREFKAEKEQKTAKCQSDGDCADENDGGANE